MSLKFYDSVSYDNEIDETLVKTGKEPEQLEYLLLYALLKFQSLVGVFNVTATEK